MEEISKKIRKNLLEKNIKSKVTMTNKQTLKIIKDPIKKAICILAMKCWRWLKKLEEKLNDR